VFLLIPKESLRVSVAVADAEAVTVTVTVADAVTVTVAVADAEAVAVTVGRVHMKFRCQKGNFFVFVVGREMIFVTGTILQPNRNPAASRTYFTVTFAICFLPRRISYVPFSGLY